MLVVAFMVRWARVRTSLATDRKAASCFAGSRGLDVCVAGEEVSLIGDLADDAGNLADFGGTGGGYFDLGGSGFDGGGEAGDSFPGLFGEIGALGGTATGFADGIFGGVGVIADIFADGQPGLSCCGSHGGTGGVLRSWRPGRISRMPLRTSPVALCDLIHSVGDALDGAHDPAHHEGESAGHQTGTPALIELEGDIQVPAGKHAFQDRLPCRLRSCWRRGSV